MEQSQLNDQGNEQSNQTQLSYIYSPAPYTIYIAKEEKLYSMSLTSKKLKKNMTIKKKVLEAVHIYVT